MTATDLAALLTKAQEAVAYSYQAGEPPTGLDPEVEEFIVPDGGLLRLYGIAIDLAATVARVEALRDRLAASTEVVGAKVLAVDVSRALREGPR